MNRTSAAIGVVVVVGHLLAAYSFLAAGNLLLGVVVLAGLGGTYWVLQRHDARRGAVTGLLWLGIWAATAVGDLLFLLLAAILATVVYVRWFRLRPLTV